MTDAELSRRLADLAQSTQGFPRISSATLEGGELRVVLEVTSDLCWFAGHFPEFPVLPGVVQLHWAVLVSRVAFGFEGTPHEVKRLKFKKLVTPPRTLELVASRHGDCEAQFAFVSPDEQNSEGRLVFSGAD
ncbi:MAG: hypothetical protein PVG24_15440 [Gammaproteobacteria bacterium]